MFIVLPCSQRALILDLEHVGNFGRQIAPACRPPWRQCTLLCRVQIFKLLCHKMTVLSIMYAANPG